MGWFDDRFQEDSRKLRLDCQTCGRSMWFPKSKHGKYLTCGGECAVASRAKAKESRRRVCETCGASFVPRPWQVKVGQGRYCSNACTQPARAQGRTPEVAARQGAKRREQFRAGTWQPLRGAANGMWKGGKEASLQRRTASGKLAQQLREYRAKNPEKVREWRQKRRGIGRLPRGTIQRLGAAQRWKCAICRVGVKNGYHVDHILPLALGGEHAPGNLQLLCGPCNVRKAAKHPVDFMQSRGYLL